MDSTIQNLRTAPELRQWSEEWNVPNDPRMLRARADLGDTDAFLALQLQDMNDLQTISEFANANKLTSVPMVKQKMLDIAPAYDIECQNNVSDINKLTSHFKNGMPTVLLTRTCPNGNETVDRTQSGPLPAEMFVSVGQLQTDPVGVSQSAFAKQPHQQMNIASYSDMLTASRSQTV